MGVLQPPTVLSLERLTNTTFNARKQWNLPEEHCFTCKLVTLAEGQHLTHMDYTAKKKIKKALFLGNESLSCKKNIVKHVKKIYLTLS